jgi:hypothetical protein
MFMQSIKLKKKWYSNLRIGEQTNNIRKKGKAVPLHAMRRLGGEEV